MPADVNVTEKVARAARNCALGYPSSGTEEAHWRNIARAALSALADPEVLAGIAGVLREHGAVTVRQGNTSRGGLIHNERVCEGCGHELPWHSWRDALADHAAAAVVEWLRGRAL